MSVVISSFSFLILSIWIIFFFSWFWLKVYKFYLLKEPSFSFIYLWYYFLFLYFIYFCSNLYDFFPSSNFRVCFCSFSSCFRCEVILFEIFPVSWGEIKLLLTSFLGLLFPVGSDSKESSSNAGGLGLIPRLGRSLGEGNGYPLQYSFLDDSMDRGAWWATVHGVANTWTWLSN